MLGTKKRTYGSKKSECGPINHKDILRNAPDTSTLFEAFSSNNIKKYRKDNSYLLPTNGHSLGFGRKRILVKRKATVCPKPKIKILSTDTSSDDSLHVKHHSNDIFDQLRLSLKSPNDPFEQLLAGDRNKQLPVKINPRLNITTDSADSCPDIPLVHKRDLSFKPSKVKKKRKSSKRKKLAPILPFSAKDDADSIIHHKFLLEKEASKKMVSPEFNFPSCSKIMVHNFATTSSSDNISETHKECDNSKIVDSFSPITNIHKKFCDNLGTPNNNIPLLSSTPYRKSRLPTYIQEHDLSVISTSENSSQGKTHYLSMHSLKKVEKEARPLSTISCNKIKDDFFKNHRESNDESIDFKMFSEPVVNVTNIFTDPVVDVTDIFTDAVVNVTNIFAQSIVSRESQKMKGDESSILSESEDKLVNVSDMLAQPDPEIFNRINYNESSILTENGDESPFRGFHLGTKENELKSQKIKDFESSTHSESEDIAVNVTDTLAKPEPRNFKRINCNESSILTEIGDESPFRGFHLGTKENELKSQKIKGSESSILSESEDIAVNVTDTLAQPEPRNFKRINYNESSIISENGDDSSFHSFHLDTKENESETLFFGYPLENNSGQGSPILFGSTISINDFDSDESKVVLCPSENKSAHLILSNTDKVVENDCLASKLTGINETLHLNNLTDVSDGMNSSFDSNKHNLTGKNSTNSMEYNLFNDSKLAKVPIVILTKLDPTCYDQGNLSKSIELESNSNNTSEIDLEANNFNPLHSTGGIADTVLDASELSRLSSEKILIAKDDCNITYSSSENVEMSTNIFKILCLSTKTSEKDDSDSKKSCIYDKDIEKEFTDSKLSNSTTKKGSKSTQNSPKCDTSISNKMPDVSKSSLDKLNENLEPTKQIVDSPIVLRNKKTVYRGQAHKNKKPARKATKSTSLDKKTSNEDKISSAEIIQLETSEDLVKTQEAFKEFEANKSLMVDKIMDEVSILNATDYSAINKGENQFVTTRNTSSSQYSMLDISAFSCLNRTPDSPNISIIEYDRTVLEENFGNSQDRFFNPRETFSNIQQISFNKQETFYNKRETTSNTRETFSNIQQMSYNKRETTSNTPETFSNKRQTSFNNRDTFYNNYEFSTRPSIVLEPGKRWERSLLILRNINRSNMTLNDTVDSCNATIQENLHPKGRKYRESVAHLIELQSKDGRRNSLADFSKTYHDTFSTTCIHSEILVEEPTLLPDAIEEDISQLSNSSTEELLSDACNDTAINLSRLAISKVARSSLLDKEEPAWSTLNARDVVLRRCNQTHPLPFDECYPDKKLQKCCKIGEGVYGEVFLYKNEDDPTNPIVMKVIPIEGTQLVNGDHQKKFEEIISEIVIAMELSDLRNNQENNTLGFNKVNRVRCVKGRYPDRLVELWELYDELKGSENDCPTLFDAGQLFIILELANGGKDLEAFKFTTAEQSYYLFFQIAFALAVAEEAFQFEHRDLHWGNVLISFAEKAEVTYKLRGEPYSIPTAGVLGNIIDFTLSRVSVPAAHTIYNDLAKDPDLFVAEGDYQFEIYRLMREKNGNLWQHFEPYTNILWLHYTLDKMITALRYERTDTCVHGIFISKLQYLKEKILQYDSCVDFVTNEECFTIADI